MKGIQEKGGFSTIRICLGRLCLILGQAVMESN